MPFDKLNLISVNPLSVDNEAILFSVVSQKADAVVQEVIDVDKKGDQGKDQHHDAGEYDEDIQPQWLPICVCSK